MAQQGVTAAQHRKDEQDARIITLKLTLKKSHLLSVECNQVNKSTELTDIPLDNEGFCVKFV